MAQYQPMVASRTTQPDLPALIASLRASIANDVGVQMFDSQHYLLKKANPWAAGEIAAAQTLLDAAPAITPQREAQSQIDNMPMVWKAIALTLLDQINVLRANDGLAAVTPAQALAAIRAKAGTL